VACLSKLNIHLASIGNVEWLHLEGVLGSYRTGFRTGELHCLQGLLLLGDREAGRTSVPSFDLLSTFQPLHNDAEQTVLKRCAAHIYLNASNIKHSCMPLFCHTFPPIPGYIMHKPQKDSINEWRAPDAGEASGNSCLCQQQRVASFIWAKGSLLLENCGLPFLRMNTAELPLKVWSDKHTFLLSICAIGPSCGRAFVQYAYLSVSYIQYACVSDEQFCN